MARREAFRAYNEYWDSSSIHDNVVSVPVKSLDEGIAFARHVEQSTFQSLNLSIQELLDCDTAVDQGCTGGNPLLAFHFIHQYGLVRSEQYSYSGDQHVCNVKLTNDPVATVTAWGILPVDSEAQMELAIRHIGPISVGVNGADPTFLSYDGGIFSLPHCKQGANHALLIVGYGEELDAESTGNTTTVTRFWIARNSVSRCKHKMIFNLSLHAALTCDCLETCCMLHHLMTLCSGDGDGAKMGLFESSETTEEKALPANAALLAVPVLLSAGSCYKSDKEQKQKMRLETKSTSQNQMGRSDPSWNL